MSYATWLAIDELDTHNKGCLVLPVPFWDNILETFLSPCSVNIVCECPPLIKMWHFYVTWSAIGGLFTNKKGCLMYLFFFG